MGLGLSFTIFSIYNKSMALIPTIRNEEEEESPEPMIAGKLKMGNH